MNTFIVKYCGLLISIRHQLYEIINKQSQYISAYEIVNISNIIRIIFNRDENKVRK